MHIIGLNGRLGSGKDTVGAYLVERHGFERLSFADKLKESAAALLDVPTALLETYKNDDRATLILSIPDTVGALPPLDLLAIRTFTVREYLQRYGTESHRDVFGESFWTDQVLHDLDPNNKYVITDVRFDNELRAVRACGGEVWRVLRFTGQVQHEHRSEAEPDYDLIDAYLDNDGSFEHLFGQVDDLIGGKR